MRRRVKHGIILLICALTLSLWLPLAVLGQVQKVKGLMWDKHEDVRVVGFYLYWVKASDRTYSEDKKTDVGFPPLMLPEECESTVPCHKVMLIDVDMTGLGLLCFQLTAYVKDGTAVIESEFSNEVCGDFTLHGPKNLRITP